MAILYGTLAPLARPFTHARLAAWRFRAFTETLMIYAITALFAFQLLGEILVQTLSLPLPGPLAGMLLLTAALLIRGGVPSSLESTASVMLQNLMLLFIPAVTGVMLYFDRVAEEWQPFLIATLGGTIITMVVTALVLNRLLKNRQEEE